MPEDVGIIIGTTEFKGWTDVSVGKSLESLCGRVQATFADKWPDELWGIIPGDSIAVTVGGKKFMTGFVDRVSSNVSKDSHDISVSGRDKTADLVDSSSSVKPGTWKKRKLDALAKILAEPFNIGVRTLVDVGDPIGEFSVKTGETIYTALEEQARQRGVIMNTDEDGNLVFTKVGVPELTRGIEYGKNVLSASSVYDHTNRFAFYTVKGQKSGGGGGWDGPSVTEISGEALDPVITRPRELIIKAESQATTSSAQKRAQWEAVNRAGKSEIIDVTVQGWRDPNGDLWQVGSFLPVKIEPLKVDAEMVLAGATYKLGSGGSSTLLNLRRLDMFAPEPVVNKKKKAALTWD